MNITAIYFSPTETTKKNVLSVAKGLGGSVTEIDVTLQGSYSAEFAHDDLVIFGAPCYGGRIPALAASRFEGFKGNGTPCIALVTYGNRDFDDALLETADLARSQGFIPFAGAAVIGQHTFGEIAVGRPDENDLEKNVLFGRQAAQKLGRGAVDVGPDLSGNHPYKEGGKGGSFRPQTLEHCVACGLCAAECPTGAIADDYCTIDNDRCISCFRCLKVCPVKAKVMDTPQYNEFAAAFSQKLAEPRENKYFI